jgi:hypothetical protein
MIRSWTSAQYLGHANLKHSLDSIKRSIENVALSPVGLAVYPDTVSGAVAGGLGGFLRIGAIGGAANGTFMYRIGDVAYIKGSGITGAINTGDKTCTLIPHHATDNTASGGFDVAATYYRAGVLLINASGVWSVKMATKSAGNFMGLTAGGRQQALGYLLEELDTEDLEDKAVCAFYVIGDGVNAFVATTSLTIATNLDLYCCGGMALATGVSTDGNQLLGLL